MIIVDEAGFVEPGVLTTLVSPMLLLDESILVTLTTHSDKSEAAYNRLLGDYDEHARRVYQKYRYAFVCPQCIAEGKTRECTHRATRLPSWQSERKLRMTEFLLRHSPADRDREVLGLASAAGGAVFDPNDVKRLFQRPRFDGRQWEAQHVFVCIDPNNGKYDSGATEKSDFAMISGYRNIYGHWVVLGAETIPASRPTDYRDRMMAHIARVRALPFARNAKLVVIIENNTADSQWISEWILNHGGGNTIMMREQELKDGCFTRSETKRVMASVARETLAGDAMHFAMDFVTTGGEADTLRALERQLLAYAERHRVPTDPSQRVVVTFSGKDGAGGKDDLVVALQLMMYWADKFWSSPKYATYR